MSSKTSKGKVAEKTTAANITFESVVGSECCTWWENAEDNCMLKETLCKEEIDKVIFMPIFYLK